MDQRPFFRRWSLDSFWCCCIDFSVSPRTIHIRLESWLREDQWYSCRAAGCSRKTCSGNTFPNMISKKICGSMRQRRIYQKYKLRGSNAAETSALSKPIASSDRRRNCNCDIVCVTVLIHAEENDMSEQSLTIRDDRTGKSYTLPIENGTVRAM